MSHLKMILDTQEFPVPEKIELPEGFRLIRCDVEYVEKYCDLRNRAGWGAPGYTHEDFVKAWRKNLLETIFLTFLGGAIGVGMGIGIAEVVAKYAGMPVAFSLWFILLALAISAAIGILFGTYPAWKAAQQNPIDVLRAE